MEIVFVFAVAENGVIGAHGAIPWRLKSDMQRFKALTIGKPVVMGRKTYESIGKPLPGRQNIVVTRDANYRREGITVVLDPVEALQVVGAAPEIMVIGGAELFRACLPRAGRVHLTRVHGDIAGDVHWPPLDGREWRLAGSESHPADERHAYAMTFEVWERR